MSTDSICPACQAASLHASPASDAKIELYHCPACQRYFARLHGHELVEKQRGRSLALVLYATIFSHHPQEQARHVATMMRNQHSRDLLAEIVADIRLELAYPELQTKNILDQSASEEDLREFLRMVADMLQEETREEAVLHTLTGHAGWVRVLAFHPTETILASGGHDGTIRLWNYLDGQLLSTLTGQQGIIFALAFDPAGKVLASGGQDGAINLWDPQSGRLQQTLQGHSGWIRALAISPDGQTIISGSTDQTVRLWELQSGRLRHRLSNHASPVYSVALRADGQVMASGDASGTIHTWHLPSGKHLHTIKGHTDKVLALIMTRHDRPSWLISGGADKNIACWDTEDGRLITTLAGHRGAVRAMVDNPRWQTIISSSEDQSVQEWNLYGKQYSLRTLTRHRGPVYGLAISPDGRFVASSSQSIKIWGKHE